MDSPDPLMTRLWFLSFRVLSLGAVIMGALAAVVGVIVAVVSVLPRTQPSPGLTLSYGVLFIVGGVAFVLICVRGFRMRARRDLDADISKTASDRDSLERWINRCLHRLTIGLSDHGAHLRWAKEGVDDG